MLDGTERGGDALGRSELRLMALTVVDAERVAIHALLARYRERRGRVEASGQQDDGTLRRHGDHRPGVSPHSTLCSWSWKRTGRRSSRIHCARSRASTWPKLGLNSTVQRSCKRRLMTRSRDHSK